MTFFARPNLEDLQFRQISGSTLTLSGTTRIATPSGLTVTDGVGGYRPIVGVGGNTYDVLTLMPDGSIRLAEPTASGATGFYTGKSPATIDLGGIELGYVLTGRTVTEILEELLTPTQEPTITTNQSQTFSITQKLNSATIPTTTTIFEIGDQLYVTGTTEFNRGTISPFYDNSGTCLGQTTPLVGLPYEFVYGGTVETPTGITSTSLSNTRSISYRVSSGNNIWTSCVRYSSGSTIYNSDGNDATLSPNPRPSGFTLSNRIVTGIYPYYWGRVASGGVPSGVDRPTPSSVEQCINSINDGNTYSDAFKVVGLSTGTINIDFNSNNDDYLWFAVHENNPIKTRWVVQEGINEGVIGGGITPGGNLFPEPVIIDNVESILWAFTGVGAQGFNLYISNYQTEIIKVMQLRNS